MEVEYEWLICNSSKVLEERVNQRIGIGFKPIGGVAVIRDSREENGVGFYQAMIKEIK